MSETPKAPFPSYSGSEPYAFVCYSHLDANEVYKDLVWLRQQGLNIWYDEGISPGRQWRDELADAIEGCSVFISFISDNAVQSPHCRKEINYAISNNKRFVAIYLKDTKLTSGLSLAMSDLQAVLKYRHTTEEFQRKIHQILEGQIPISESDSAELPTFGRSPLDWARVRRAVNRGAWIAVLAIGVLYLARWLYQGGSELETVAVLPFENFTGDPSNEYLSAGIAEEVINLLENLDSINVVGRTASFYFAGKDVEFTTIAEKLHADVVLEGSIRANEERIRIAAQLINGVTGVHEWSEIFEQDWGDLMLMQQQIALQVASQLTAVLTDNDIQLLSTAPTSDNEAYKLYLEGRNYLRLASTARDLNTAKNLFNRAIEVDAAFSRAQSGVCEAELALYQLSLSSDDYAIASATCARLVAQDDPDPDSLVALATLNRFAGNLDEALVLYDRALAKNPNSEPAYYGRGRVLQGMGRLAEAEASLRNGITQEPGYWAAYSGYGLFLVETGRVREAITQFEQAVALTPDNPQAQGNLGSALFMDGDWEQAEIAWQVSLNLAPTGHGYLNLGTAVYYQGRYSEAAEIFSRGTKAFPDFYRLWGKLGAAMIAAGQAGDAAAEAFHRAIDLAEPLLEINQEDKFALALLCVYHARVNDAGALAFCERAIEVDPRDPEVNYLYATALQLTGERTEAERMAGKAVELGYSPRMRSNDPVFRQP